MSRATRTFIAVTLPDSLTRKLTRLQALLGPELPGTRWSATLPFHLTLAFLGDVPDADLNAICRATVEASASSSPFDLRLEGLGAFPAPGRPRVIWVGVNGAGLVPLERLRADIVGAVRDVGHPPEDDRFHPHVTLGRVKTVRGAPLDLTPWIKHYQTWSAGAWPISEAVVLASTLTPDGPEYMPLVHAPLRGRKPA
jgi:2'-5' RNA ligase